MFELLAKALSVARDAAETATTIKSRRRRRLVATDVRICHDALVEIVKRGQLILREMELLARDDRDADGSSVAVLIVLPRLQYRLRMQSIAIQRLSAALKRVRHALRLFAPDVTNNIGEIVLEKESALVELSIAIDRGDFPTLISLRKSREPFTSMVDMPAAISFSKWSEIPEHERLRNYLDSGAAKQHLGTLEEAARQLRQFLIDHFTVDELLDSTGASRFGDPDAIPGRF